MPGKKYYFWRHYAGKKLLWPVIVLSVFSLIIFLRLVQLQLVQGSYYLNRADRNRIHYSYIRAPRGEILDRRGEVLAGNRPNYSLYVSLEGLTDAHKKEIARILQELTARSVEDTMQRFASIERGREGSAVLFRHLSRDEIITIEENHHRLPRVFIQTNPIRKYPQGESISHFTGYIGEINPSELQRMMRYGYRMGDIIGKTGIEKEFEHYLMGRRGYRKIEVGVIGRHRKILEEVEPQIGSHIVTTIDARLQRTAAEAMGENHGAVIAMDPGTGEILVWLSSPGFNPEEFTVALEPARARDLFADPMNPLFDRVIKGQFSPGSVFKSVVAMAALESDPASSEIEYNCTGSIEIGFDRRVFRCWKEGGHGRVDMKQAIAESCNVYFYQTGLRVGHDKIVNMSRRAGLGARVQKLLSGEMPGLIPSSSWKERTVREIWYPGDTANLSIGQGYILVTPVQLLRLTSLIACEGRYREPYGVRMIVSGDGKEVKKFDSPATQKAEINPEDVLFVKNALREAVQYGTGASIRFYGVGAETGGKTGTSQNPFGDDHGWFTAFAPVDNPQIAIVVLVEHGGTGSVSALPVAAAVLREKFRTGS